VFRRKGRARKPGIGVFGKVTAVSEVHRYIKLNIKRIFFFKNFYA